MPSTTVNVSPLDATTGVPPALVSGVEPVTANFGARPCAFRSARSLSPSRANAALRIVSIRPVSVWAEATVKFHASYRFGPTFIRARRSDRKIAW